jgi:hypothetical protein
MPFYGVFEVQAWVFWYLTEPLYCVFKVPLMPFYCVFEVQACMFWYLTEPLYCVFRVPLYAVLRCF